MAEQEHMSSKTSTGRPSSDPGLDPQREDPGGGIVASTGTLDEPPPEAAAALENRQSDTRPKVRDSGLGTSAVSESVLEVSMRLKRDSPSAQEWHDILMQEVHRLGKAVREKHVSDAGRPPDGSGRQQVLACVTALDSTVLMRMGQPPSGGAAQGFEHTLQASAAPDGRTQSGQNKDPPVLPDGGTMRAAMPGMEDPFGRPPLASIRQETADRAQEIILEQLPQMMSMLDRTLMPVRMAQALEELKERAAFESRCDSVRERSAVASGGWPAGQISAAAAVISGGTPDPGAASDGTLPDGTVMCVTAEAAAAPESRRIDDGSAEKDGGSGAMAPQEFAQEVREEALRIELPQGGRQVPLQAAAAGEPLRRPLEEGAIMDHGPATSQADTADYPSDEFGRQLVLAPVNDGIPPGRPPDGQPPGCEGGQAPGSGGGDILSHALLHGGDATASVNVTTVKMKLARQPREVGHYLLRQKVFVTKIDGRVGREANLLFRLDLPVSLITFDLANEFGLAPTSMQRRIETPYGREDRSDRCFDLEIMGRPGETPVTVRLWGVNKIMHCPAQRSPPGMNTRFPSNSVPSEFLWLPPGEMQLLLADDHHWLHPQLLCPSSVRNETLALYRSRFQPCTLVGGSFAHLPSPHAAEAERLSSSEASWPLPKPLPKRSVTSDNAGKISTASGTARHDSRPLSARRSASYLLHDDIGDLHPPICQPEPQVRLPGRRAASIPTCPADVSTAGPATSLPTGTSNNSLIRLVPEKP